MATIPRSDSPPSPNPSADAVASETCDCCQEVGGPSARLVHDSTGTTIRSCLRCLRSVMQMRVDKADTRGSAIMYQSAAELGWRVWRAEDSLYLLPDIDPFSIDDRRRT